MDYDEEFTCSVCLNLMVDPTTLNCGHNLCRMCLAHWFITSHRKVCPSCRQVWEGHPKINTSLKNLITRMHPEQLREREQEIAETEGSTKMLNDFEHQLLKEKQKGNKRTDYGSFLSGIIIALGVVVIAYLVYYWRGSDDDMLVHKPVASWRTADVVKWLDNMKWASAYSEAAYKQGIDGNMLMAMSETYLFQQLNVTDMVHQSALQLAITSLRETGVKMPETLWEYKALYPGRSLFLVYALKDFPRTTMVLLYFYYYEESFLPFLHTTAPADWGKEYPKTEMGKLPEPTTFQWLVFWLFMLVLPYWMLGLFAWSMLSVHTLTPWFVMSSCALLTLMESTFLADVVLRGAWRQWREISKHYFKQLTSCVLFSVIWPVTPSFICDVAFYVCLYISPIQLLKTVRQRMPVDPALQ